MSNYNYKPLHITADLDDEPDYVELQSEVDLELFTAEPVGEFVNQSRLELEFVGMWLDVGGNVVTIGGRGTYSLHLIKKVKRGDGSTILITDSVPEHNIPAGRPVTVGPVLNGVQCGVRITNMERPDVTAVTLRIEYFIMPGIVG